MYTKFWLVCILEKSFLTATVGYYRSNLRQLQVCKVIPQFMLYVIPTQMRFEETLTLTLQRVTWPPQRAAFQERPISLLLDHLLCPSCRCSLQRKQRIIVGTNSHPWTCIQSQCSYKNCNSQKNCSHVLLDSHSLCCFGVCSPA